MKKIIMLFGMAVLGTALAFGGDNFPDIKGWKPAGEVMSYGPDNLYEYIDGAADQFLDYGFQSLKSRDISNDGLTVTVDIYDMGDRINAFGIYKTERDRQAKGLPIGAEAIVSPPYQCLLLKGRFYVKVNAFEGEITDSTGAALLRAIAQSIPGESRLPEVLQLLPAQNKIAGSEGYTRLAFSGLGELNRCIHASYQGEDKKEFQYFVVLARDKATPASIWATLAEKWQPLKHQDIAILVKKVPYKGLIGVALGQNRIIGVTNCADESEIIRRLQMVLAEK